MYKTFGVAALAALLTIPATAQTQPTAAELLQKGIYAQETAGDLDGAIKIYHQIVDSHPIQREIAAQAQYRLGLTLLAKGDAGSASQEIQRLGWDFPDYKELIAASKSASATFRAPITFTVTGPTSPERRLGDLFDKQLDQREAAAQDQAKLMALEAEHDAAYDFSKTVTVTGTVAQNLVSGSSAWMTVNPVGGGLPVRVSIESVNGRVRAGGIGKTLIPGDQVIVTGASARDGSSTIQATRVSDNGTQVYLRSATAEEDLRQAKWQGSVVQQLVQATYKDIAGYLQVPSDGGNYAFVLGTGGDLEKEFDFTKQVGANGTVAQVQMISPAAWLTVTFPGSIDPPVRVRVMSPSALAAQGWTKDTLKVGDSVAVVGAPARDGTSIIQAMQVSANGHVLWSASAMK